MPRTHTHTQWSVHTHTDTWACPFVCIRPHRLIPKKDFISPLLEVWNLILQLLGKYCLWARRRHGCALKSACVYAGVIMRWVCVCWCWCLCDCAHVLSILPPTWDWADTSCSTVEDRCRQLLYLNLTDHIDGANAVQTEQLHSLYSPVPLFSQSLKERKASPVFSKTAVCVCLCVCVKLSQWPENYSIKIITRTYVVWVSVCVTLS